MGKTIAEQECARVVKHGKRLLLLGIPPKLIYFLEPRSIVLATFWHDVGIAGFRPMHKLEVKEGETPFLNHTLLII